LLPTRPGMKCWWVFGATVLSARYDLGKGNKPD
jgi:hypothetical protein